VSAVAEHHRLLLVCILLLVLGLAFGLLVACEPRVPEPTTLPTGTFPPPGMPTPPAGEPTPQVSRTLTLTVWTTEAYSPTQATAQGRILAAQAVSLPGTRFRFVPKQPYGQAGVLRYLLNTGAAVPALLPDLAFLDVYEVGQVVQAGLAQPLDSLLSPDLVADLYAFAREACTFDGKLYCLQIEADLDHLVYNSFRLSRPPASWAGVLSQGATYVFPAGGEGGLVNDGFLAQYGAVWPRSASTTDDAPYLDEASLVAVLQFYQDGASQGLFPPAILQFRTSDDSWQAYRSGQAAMAQVSAHRYLADRSQAVFARPAAVPSISGSAAPISRGWALMIVTPDPARQTAAARFLDLWLSSETAAAWNLAAGTLPTLQSSLTYWDPMDGYKAFLQRQLEAAHPRPAVPEYNQVAAALQQAVEAVLTGELTPEEAAAHVMSTAP
jgi:multiple sugar transport system substrate-binding protein